ncbi:MAG TPA: sensor histidine kinase [Opitutaceae bacterium]|nr:sensor histidine kinase [Opitutaceae bacterium]
MHPAAHVRNFFYLLFRLYYACSPLALGTVLIVATPTFGQETERVLTRAIEVRSLPPSEARKNIPIHLRGTVTFFDGRDAVFFHDESAGTFFRPQPNQVFTPGDIIDVHGITQPGLYIPGIYLSTTVDPPVQVVGKGPLPKPIEARYSDLITGRYHYQQVVLEGVVRSIGPLNEARFSGAPPSARSVMRLAMDGEILEVRAETGQTGAPEIDSLVRVSGLAAGIVNSRRQLVQPYVRIEDWSPIQILEPAVSEAAIPRISGSDMLTYRAAGPADRRARLHGIVTAVISATTVYLRSEGSAFQAKLTDATTLQVGDRIEIIGFTEMDRFSAHLADAKLISRTAGPVPPPVELQIDESIAGTHAGELVAVAARVTDSFRTESGAALTLQRNGRAIQVRGPLPVSWPQVGSSVRVVGICQVESVAGTRYNASPDAIVIRLRDVADLTVLSSPSAWTVRRLAVVLAVLIALVLLGALWITSLKRQVARQTATLQVKIGSEAVLQERQRIAREFHDSLEQELAGLNLRLDAIASRTLEDRARTLLQASRHLVARIQAETRNLISDLRNPAEVAGDLPAALQEVTDRYRDQPGATVRLFLRDTPPRLAARTVHHLRMITAEAVNNAVKHAEPTQVTIELRSQGSELDLTIADDGRGFDPERETRGKAGHFGCVGIRERCRALGGMAQWTSQPGQGTRLKISLPLDASTMDAHPLAT